MKYVLLLNGPPRCGKDTAVSFLQIWPGCQLMRFSEPLKRTIAAFLDQRPTELEVGKDEARYFGLTYRQWQISMSEDWIKPKLGAGFFGRMLAQRVEESDARLIVVPDSGFVVELEALTEALRSSDTRVGLLRIKRPGTSFEGDSRSFVVPPRSCEFLGEVQNDSSFYTFCGRVRLVVTKWMRHHSSREDL